MLKNQLQRYQAKFDGTHNGLKARNRSDKTNDRISKYIIATVRYR